MRFNSDRLDRIQQIIGGAVVHPNLEVLQIAEISSINNRVFRTLSSPMIVAPNDWITFRPMRGSDFVLTVDSDSYHNRDIVEIQYKISKKGFILPNTVICIFGNESRKLS